MNRIVQIKTHEHEHDAMKLLGESNVRTFIFNTFKLEEQYSRNHHGSSNNMAVVLRVI